MKYFQQKNFYIAKFVNCSVLSISIFFLLSINHISYAEPPADPRPGEKNPLSQPGQLTLFPSESIGILLSENNSAYSDISAYTAQNGALSHWGLQTWTLKSTDPCADSPKRRLISGRVLTPNNDQSICLTEFGLSLYPKTNKASADYLSFQYSNPGIGGDARSFAADTGYLVGKLNAQGQGQEEIAAVHQDYSNSIRLDVINAAMTLVANYVSTTIPSQNGDVSIAVGDYDGDADIEILLAFDISTNPSGAGKIRMESIRIETTGSNSILTMMSHYEFSTQSGRPKSITLNAADYVGNGSDQVILSYYENTSIVADAGIKLKLFRLGSGLAITTPELSAKLGTPANGSFFDTETAQFILDPSNNYLFGRRQLALSYVDTNGHVNAQVVGVHSNYSNFNIGVAKTLSTPGYATATAGIGPGIAAGNFIGLQSTSINPRAQLAVSIPLIVGKSGENKTIPAIATATVNNQTLAITPGWHTTLSAYETGGVQFSWPLLSYDPTGRSFYLGNPAHISVPSLIDPEYIIGMPPKHVDYLPVDPANPSSSKEIINVSGYPLFYVELTDSSQKTLKETSIDTVSSTFGMATTQTVSGSVTAGNMDIAGVQVSTTVKAAAAFESEAVEASKNSLYQSRTIEQTAQTNHDDVVVWNSRIVDIWRYPVYGLDLQRIDKFPFYELIIPGPLTKYIGGGRSIDWYNPRKSNNNILSYTKIGTPNFPSELGSFTYGPDNTEVTTILNEARVHTFDGNAQTLQLEWTTTAGSAQDKSYKYSLKKSLDVTVGMKATGSIKGLGASGTYEGTISLSDDSSIASSSVSEREISESSGFKLVQPSVGSVENKSYNYKTVAYITDSGTFKVDHAVDVTGTASGKAWWRSYYSGRADPALNLPSRFTQTGRAILPVWTLTTGDAYYNLRGLSLHQSTPDAMGDYPYLAGGVNEGTIVRVQVKVYNFSLDTIASNVTATFYYQQLNPTSGFSPVGSPVAIGTSLPFAVEAQGYVPIALNWDTANLGLTGAGTPYRIKIVLDENGSIENEIHELGAAGDNNQGSWPWGTGFYIFNTGSAGDLLVEKSTTRQPEKINIKITKKAALVEIQATSIDRAIRHLTIILDDELNRSELQKIIAVRTLYGLDKGTTRVKIPIPFEYSSNNNLKLRAVLTNQ